MSASRMRPWPRLGLAAMAVATLGVFAWLLFLREEGADNERPEARAAGISARAERLARGLSRSEQIDQVLLLGFEGADASAPFLGEVRESQLGGVLVGAHNGAGEELMAALGRAGRSAGVPPLLVAAHEGGIYRAFGELPPEERAIDIGDRGAPDAAERWARDTAAALREAGFHLNLFPVADVATLNSPMGGRAFSDDSAVGAELTAAALRGCAEAELACAPAHFPGLGAASQDTAQGPATVSLDARSLAARDLEPFRAAVAAEAPALVLSLAFYAAYDPVTPGALVPEIATGLLREELGFTGVAITDDLGAGAVAAQYRPEEAAVAALRAGADLIQVADPGDPDRLRAALQRAVESGEVPAGRLAEAAARVLELKRKLGLTGG